MRTGIRLCAWLTLAMLFVHIEPITAHAEENTSSCVGEAEKWLDSIRTGPEYFDDFIGPLSDALTRCGKTLRDIGTSEVELEELRERGCAIEAGIWLGHLRNGTSQYESFIRYVRSAAKRCDLTLEEVGTSKMELEELRRKNASSRLN